MPSWKDLKIVPNEHPILRIIPLVVLLECFFWGGDAEKDGLTRTRLATIVTYQSSFLFFFFLFFFVVRWSFLE